MQLERIPARRDVTPCAPEWETFRVAQAAVNHLTIGRYAGMRVALCGQHLEVRRLLPLELAPDAVRCSVCERLLEPGGPDVLTPKAFRAVAEAELELRPELYLGGPSAAINRFVQFTVRDWERILMQLKGHQQ